MQLKHHVKLPIPKLIPNHVLLDISFPRRPQCCLYWDDVTCSHVQKKVIDKCFRLGLCISYDRIMQISNKVANSVCDYYNSEQLVCPPVLRKGLFTVAAGDNIDHNLSSSTAKSSFHGTAISLMQFPTNDHPRIERLDGSYSNTASDQVSCVILPHSYTDVSPCVLPTKDLEVSVVLFSLAESMVGSEPEYDWLNNVSKCISIDHAHE